MARKYFGTDGIRGSANSDPMTAEIALRVGMAAGRIFTRGAHRHTVVIGKDTRLSGYMLEPALVAGFTAMGMDVILVGPMPTPAVAMLTRSLRADMGVMIEAEMSSALAQSENLGRAKRLDDAEGRYIEFVKNTFPRGLRLDGLKIVVDCANGAAYKVAPTALWELGADVVTYGVEPDGFNINKYCGSTDTRTMCRMVREHGADIGIALDGDADRVLVADETGRLLDGDQLMATVAESWHAAGRLSGGGVVATVMSNLGLEKYIQGLGLDLVRTQVGDRYVVEHMRANGFNVGGEQSGHIVLSDYTTTGDGLVAAMEVLSAMVQSGQKLSQVGRKFEPLPQVLENVRFSGTPPLDHATVVDAIREGEGRLVGTGRLLIRKSGTEPLIRVMAEGEDLTLVQGVVTDIVAAIEQVAG